MNARETETRFPLQVALVSLPWQLYDRPSIQLGALKAYVEREHPRVAATTHSFYLMIAEALGFALYGRISLARWAGECIYAALVYPDRSRAAEALFESEDHLHNLRRGLSHQTSFPDLCKTVQRATDSLIGSVDWDRYDIVGVTITFNQLLSSIYFIRQLKVRFPEIPIIVGGTTFFRGRAGDWLAAFPEVDFVVTGEGESPLLSILEWLSERPNRGPTHPDVHCRLHGTFPNTTTALKECEIRALPAPDYTEYFERLGTVTSQQRFFPSLPVEGARGCPYASNVNSKKERGCAFCNMNHQWLRYRKKKPDQMVGEIAKLINRHQILKINILDNYLSPTMADKLFAGLRKLGKDVHVFPSVRAETSKEVLYRIQSGGGKGVQVGIEALSTALLKRMGKKIKAIDNLRIMRDCEELGLICQANMILGFPGSTETEVAETLRCISYANVFRPLNPNWFWLGAGSRIWRDQDQFGIFGVRNHDNYRVLLPESIANSVLLPQQSYDVDEEDLEALWSPVHKALIQWTDSYNSIRSTPYSPPLLYYQDGGDFLIVTHLNVNGDSTTRRLSKSARDLYLMCLRPRHLEEIESEFPRVSREVLASTLRQLTSAMLIYEEEGFYLSLAVRRR
ncbi:cobalamin-binding radical SAM domain protein [Desulfosarcina variabilis str. Montpellier]|uniref:RiPP maturation radical SAM C-methyltransferase n=1 Tax=Desulfosarcina variabilis TaxID=2300 RepID=UPI003AFA8E15